jgi:deoxyribose-phosphate aldolase
MDDLASSAARALALVDLTDLTDHCTPEAIDTLCRRAVGPYGSTAAVCVWPAFVSQAKALLADRGVRVATVVNFPAGGDDIGATLLETRTAIADGADEIDLVLPYRSFLAGRVTTASDMVEAVRDAVHHPRLLKVILETGSYDDQDQVAAAARLAIDAGADFIKTSTGKTSVSATLEATATMLAEIRRSGRRVGLKPSGGIRTLDDAERYLAQADEIMGPDWATPETFRFGASGLLDALEAVLAGSGGTAPGSDY